ncbi:hypothetical protein BH11PLA1_BH11PLA1_24400 [soil metagenome]
MGIVSAPPATPMMHSGDTPAYQRPPRGRWPARRGVWAFAWFAIGLASARYAAAPEPMSAFGAAALVLIVAVFTQGWACRVSLCVVLVLLGAGMWSLRVAHAPADVAATRAALRTGNAAGEERLVTLRGVILDGPTIVEQPVVWRDAAFHAAPTTRFTLALNAVGDPGAPALGAAAGTVRITLRWPESAWRAGDQVRLTGAFRAPAAPVNPGEPDPRLRGVQDDGLGFVTVESAGLIERTDDPLGTSAALRAGWGRAVEGLRGIVHSALKVDGSTAGGGARTHAADPRPDALLSAMLLGDAEAGAAEVSGSFARLGLIHALSISGFHLAVLAWFALVAVRGLGEIGRWENLIVALVIVLYVLLVPAEAPILRSAAAILIWLAAQALGRRYDALNLLGWSATALLIWRPMDLWDVGFQLSFGVTAALIWLAPWASATLTPPALAGVRRTPMQRAVLWVRGHTGGGLATAGVAWLISAPLVAYHTGMIGPIALLGSLAVLPLLTAALVAGYLTLGLGLLGGAAGVVLPEALRGVALAPAHAANFGAHLLARWSLALTDALDTIPGAAWCWPALPLAWVAGATVVLALMLRWPRARWRWAPALGGLVLLAGLAVILLRARAGAPEMVLIDELDTRGGGCALVRSGPDAVLIDAGSTSPGAAERMGLTVSRAVRALGAWRVETMVLTRPDAAHAAGAVEAARRIGVRRVLVSPAFAAMAEHGRASAAAEVLERLRAMGIEVVRADPAASIWIGAAELRWTATGEVEITVGGAAGGETLTLAPGRRSRAVTLRLAPEP